MANEIQNPATPAEIVATCHETPAIALDNMVPHTRTAQAAWTAMPQPKHIVIVPDFFTALEATTADIALSITKEMGKTLAKAHGEAKKSVGEAGATSARAGSPIGEIFTSQISGTIDYSTCHTRGVILGINRQNFLFSTLMRKTLSALIHDNAIILKPAYLTLGAITLMAPVASENLVLAVIGNSAMSQVLAEHGGVDAVSFTRLVEVGKQVAVAAAGYLAELPPELGGKNLAVLNDASDLDRVLDQTLLAVFAVCGQRCTAITWVIVDRELEATIVTGLAARTATKEPVDGTAEGAKISPLAGALECKDVTSFFNPAVSESALITAGRQTINRLRVDYFYASKILSGITRDTEIACQEAFGPVLSVIAYDNVEEALSITNDVDFGLSSSLYSERTGPVERFVAESASSMLHVNAGSCLGSHLPFVGVKDGALGIGGSNGSSTIQFYTTEHEVYRRTSF